VEPQGTEEVTAKIENEADNEINWINAYQRLCYVTDADLRE
jgi:hypothetical protein